VSERDHRPGGFSLELGLKDVTLVSQAAREADTPMPFLSVLLDRFTSAKAKGRGQMDWSAIGMNVSEDAGINMKNDLERNAKAVLPTGPFDEVADEQEQVKQDAEPSKLFVSNLSFHVNNIFPPKLIAL
jgi:hypothetical protein